jgi:ribosomal protein S7
VGTGGSKVHEVDINRKAKKKVLEIIKLGIKNCNPYFQLKNLRKRGISIKQAYPLTLKEQEYLAIRWIIEVARKDKGPMSKALAKQFLLASNNQGEVIKKVSDLHHSQYI